MVKVVVAPDISVMLVQQGETKPPKVFGTELKTFGTFRQAEFRDIAYADLGKFDFGEVSKDVTNLTVIPRHSAFNVSMMMSMNSTSKHSHFLAIRVYCLASGAFELMVRPKTDMAELIDKKLLTMMNSTQRWRQLFFCRAESEVVLLFDTLQSVNSDSEYINIKIISRSFGSIIANLSKVFLSRTFSSKIANKTTGQVDAPLSLLDSIVPKLQDQAKKRLKTPALNGTLRSTNTGARILLYLVFVAMVTGCIIRIRYYFLKQETTRLSRLRLHHLRNSRQAFEQTGGQNPDESNADIAGNNSKIDNTKYETLVSKRVLGTDLGPWNEAR